MGLRFILSSCDSPQRHDRHHTLLAAPPDVAFRVVVAPLQLWVEHEHVLPPLPCWAGQCSAEHSVESMLAQPQRQSRRLRLSMGLMEQANVTGGALGQPPGLGKPIGFAQPHAHHAQHGLPEHDLEALDRS